MPLFVQVAFGCASNHFALFAQWIFRIAGRTKIFYLIDWQGACAVLMATGRRNNLADLLAAVGIDNYMCSVLSKIPDGIAKISKVAHLAVTNQQSRLPFAAKGTTTRVGTSTPVVLIFTHNYLMFTFHCSVTL